MLLGEGDIYWMMAGLMITGFGGATSYVIPHSMKADVIDLDKLNSGEDRAASFFAVWSFITKISYSFGPWFAFMMLAYIGFDPTPGVVNEGNNILGLKLVYSFSTSIFFIATILVLYKYPLTQARHEELRKELEEKTSI
jgi:Na+/melibiose symporter-like transporter